MRVEEFECWLTWDYKTKNGAPMVPEARSSRLSNCKRVEAFEGDLDRHFTADRFRNLQERLRYTKGDERAGLPARHNIPIDGNIREGTATFRSSINLYLQFCELAAGNGPH
jgi:hypothetical protein